MDVDKVEEENFIVRLSGNTKSTRDCILDLSQTILFFVNVEFLKSPKCRLCLCRVNHLRRLNHPRKGKDLRRSNHPRKGKYLRR